MCQLYEGVLFMEVHISREFDQYWIRLGTNTSVHFTEEVYALMDIHFTKVRLYIDVISSLLSGWR